MKSGFEILLVVAFAVALALVWGGCATQPDDTKRVRSTARIPIQEVSETHVEVASVSAISEASTTTRLVSETKTIDPVVKTYIEVPGLLEQKLASATHEEVQAILAQIEANLQYMTIPEVKAILEIAVRNKWYETFDATPGGHLWWIMRIAREKAERGEDISKWETEFRNTMNEWLMEGD